MITCDVIIAGAGPAGSYPAYLLASAGVDVLLLDRAEFPRYKSCGGVIPWACLNLLPAGPDSLELIPIEKYTLTHQGRNPAEGTIAGNSLYSLDRGRFDNYLLSQAISSGAKFRPKTRLSAFQQSEKNVRVTTSEGETFEGRILINACGFDSNISALLCPEKKSKTGACCYYEFQPKPDIPEKFTRSIILNFEFAKRSFAGVIPKAHHLWVGIYRAEETNLRRLRGDLEKYMDSLNLEGEKIKFSGRLLQLYDGNRFRRLQQGNILTTGEAGGLVNPLSGEGIKPAMDSGKAVAEAVIEHLKRGNSLIEYYRQVSNTIGKEMELAGRFEHIAYLFPDITYNGMIRVTGNALDILNGRLSYGDFFSRLKRKILRESLPGLLE